MENNIIYHYQGKDPVGVTMIDAKKYGVKNEGSRGSRMGLD